jgi:hypothetical protein
MSMEPTSAPGRLAEPASSKPRRRDVFVKVAICVLFAVATFPDLKPLRWGVGIEWSWQMALAKSVERGLVYGQDFCFTYGPLGFLSCPRDIGGLLVTACVWRVALHALFCLSIALNVWHCRSLLLAALLPLIILFSKVQDDTSTMILLAELAFLTVALQGGSFWPALPAVFLAAVGVLVKFNFGVAGLLSLILWTILVALGPRRKELVRWSVPLGAVFAASFLCCFQAYGGPLSAIPDFLKSSIRIASGYSAQMTTAGPATDLYHAFFCIGLVTVALITGSFFQRRYAALAFLLSATVLVIFKSAFTRHDGTHVTLFMETFPALVALLLTVPEARMHQGIAAAIGLIVLGVAIHGRPLLVTNPDKVATEARSSQNASREPVVDMNKVYRSMYLPEGPGNLLDAFDWSKMQRKYGDEARGFLAKVRMPAAWLTRIGNATVDAYPWEASLLFANKLNWSPRPVFQSYTAYVPDLDEANARHYASADGPRFILFHFNSIDEQHPWFVDPRTLRECYRNYDPVDRAGNFLLLRRRAQPREMTLELAGTATAHLGQSVTVPRPDAGLMFAAFQFRLTAGGKAREMLWKVYPPSVQLTFADGSTHTSRFVWRNAVSGVPISDLPMSHDDVDALWDTKKRRAVQSITLLADPKDFEEDVEVTWLKLEEKSPPVSQ